MDLNELREQMVREWGLEGLTPEEQDTAIDKVGSILYQSIVLRTTELLEDAQLKEFEAFVQKQGADLQAPAALDWLRERVPDFDRIVTEETEKLKQEVLEVPE